MLGGARLLTSSEGERIEAPRWYRVEQNALQRRVRQMARRQPGSAGRRRAGRQLARQYVHLDHARRDWIDKLVHGLVARYDRVAVLELRVPGDSSSSLLADQRTHLVQRLMRKAADAGRVVWVVADPGPNDRCARCGERARVEQAPQPRLSCVCGASLDRDQNTALRILERAGHARWGLS